MLFLAGFLGFQNLPQYTKIYRAISLGLAGMGVLMNPVVRADTGPAASGLSPHRAVYDISLAATKSSAQIANVSGQMFYEFKAGCDAWNTNHKFKLNYEYADSPGMQILTDFSTYEPFDGKSITFSTRRRKDGEVVEEFRGHADRETDGTGKAIFTAPPALSFDLSKETLFPAAHTISIMKAVKAGQKFHHAEIFDGSDGEGPVEVNTVIGKIVAQDDLSVGKTIDVGLMQSPARRARLAFYAKDEESGAPEYEMDVTFHENGVISDMLIEYHDFSVRKTLKALEPLSGGCDKKS